MQLRAVGSVVVLVVVGCAKRIGPPPPEQLLTLAGHTAPVRAWADYEALCDVKPEQWAREHDAMQVLLADWLGQTSAPADGAWDDEHLAVLEQGLTVLPEPLKVEAAALDSAKQRHCYFQSTSGLRELVSQAQRRVEEGAWLATEVKARLALARWKEAQPAAIAQAHEQSCLTKMKPKEPILYYAAEDETARLEWRFCDGSHVVATPGNTPAWEPDPAARKPKKDPDPRVWLDIAARYPPGQISRAPKLPRKHVEHGDDAPEPDDHL